MTEDIHAVEGLFEELRRFRDRRGGYSTRSLGEKIDVSHMTIQKALNGPKVPTWKIVLRIVEALADDDERGWQIDRFRHLWLEARRHETLTRNEGPHLTEQARAAVLTYRNKFALVHDPIQVLGSDRLGSVLKMFVQPDIRSTVDGAKRLSVQDLMQTHRTVIVGSPGCGKTTLCLYVALTYARDVKRPIPFFVKVRDFAHQVDGGNGSLIDYLERLMRSVYQCDLSGVAIRSLLTSGRALVIFDGLDEVLGAASRTQITRIIDLAANEFPLTEVFVTSRTVGYSTSAVDMNVFGSYQIGPLSQSQIAELAQHYDTFVGGDNRLRQGLAAWPTELTRDLASNPLMLTILLTLDRRGYSGDSRDGSPMLAGIIGQLARLNFEPVGYCKRG